ncbi:MAG TPA: (2Fe-2S)-binding protein [Bradyrhizobium sp.]|jgi:carbon-monoxide dehydrogenase small subunit
MLTVTLTINDDEQTHTIEPRTVLADLLRDQCGLTGTHLGCEHGACGACTLEVDGKATRSCVILAAMCEGRSVRTIEGLRDDKIMEVLRRHFHQLHGVQCGFCTPGMLVMARDILGRHRKPSEKTIRRELSGQVCRCTGYANIVAAIGAAGAELDQEAAS